MLFTVLAPNSWPMIKCFQNGCKELPFGWRCISMAWCFSHTSRTCVKSLGLLGKKRYFYALRRVKASHSKTTMNHTKERKTCQNSSDVWNMNFHSLERSHFNLNTSEKMKIQQYDLPTPQKPASSPTTFFLRRKVPWSLLTNLPDPDGELQASERPHPKGEQHFWGWQLMLSLASTHKRMSVSTWAQLEAVRDHLTCTYLSVRYFVIVALPSHWFASDSLCILHSLSWVCMHWRISTGIGLHTLQSLHSLKFLKNILFRE